MPEQERRQLFDYLSAHPEDRTTTDQTTREFYFKSYHKLIGDRVESGGDSSIAADVQSIIDNGLFDPELKKPPYDQFTDAIKSSMERRDADTLWAIAKAVRHFPGLTSGLAKYAICEAILIEHHFATQEMNRPEMFWYNLEKGIYQPHAKTKIRPIIRREMEDVSTHLVQEVVEGIRDRTYRSKEDFHAPINLICVKNGILNIETGELKSHTPEVIFLSNINAKYDSSKDCPNFRKFLTEVLSDERDQRLIEEWFGYMLWREMIYHVILMLLGDGRNGKTTLLNVMRKFLGNGNYSSKTMYDLAASRFALFGLYGKLANISGEIGLEGGGILKNIGMLKNLSGNEEIPMEQKFKDGFSDVNNAKLCFSTNQLPLTKDATLGNWSRWLLVIFRKTFHRGAPTTDPRLIDKLTTEDELSGILNLAIRGLKRLNENKNFSYDKTPDDVKELWALSANPVHAFVKEWVKSGGEDLMVTHPDLFNKHKRFCDERKVACYSIRRFNSLLKEELPNIKMRKLGARGQQIATWIGITLKTKEEREKEIEEGD